MKKIKLIGAVLILMISIFAVTSFANAASSITDSTIVYSDTSTPTATAINTITVQEIGNTSFGNGYFTIKIPSDVKLCNLSSNTTTNTSITRNTTVLGSATTPKALYVLRSGVYASGAQAAIYFSSGSNNYSILNVSILDDGYVGFGIPSSSASYVHLVDWTTATSPITIAAGDVGTLKVGQIYFNDTTNQTVISLAASAMNDGASESLLINGFKLEPDVQNSTGTVSLSILDGDANGDNGIGITNDFDVKVMELVNQSVIVSGTISPATVPLITAGQVAAQPMGVLKLNFIAEPSVNTSSTITFTLDNGAKFHPSANDPINSSGYTMDGLASSQVDGDFFVDSYGQLVWTIETPQSEINANNTFQFNADFEMIDAFGITSNCDINCIITGTGAFDSLNQTIKVATADLSGTTISFIDDAEPGVPTLYAGDSNQELGSGEYVLVGEKAPGSLLQGGYIKVELSNGAQFYPFSNGFITEYTDTFYQNSSFSISSSTNSYDSSSYLFVSVNQSSSGSGTLGAFTVGVNAVNWLDLTKATPGDLLMTFSGNAGASGTVKIATIMENYNVPIDVLIDIKPGACPNPLNVKSNGVLTVAILGTYSFDVADIDIASVELNGVAPLRSSIEDVSNPANVEYCNDFGIDGHDDLILKFDTQEIAASLSDVTDGDEIELILTGALSDGTIIEGQDSVTIIKKGKSNCKFTKGKLTLKGKGIDFDHDGLVDIEYLSEDFKGSSGPFLSTENGTYCGGTGSGSGNRITSIHDGTQFCDLKRAPNFVPGSEDGGTYFTYAGPNIGLYVVRSFNGENYYKIEVTDVSSDKVKFNWTLVKTPLCETCVPGVLGMNECPGD